MLTKDDIKAIGSMMDQKLAQQKNEIITAVDEKLTQQKSEIITAMADLFADSVLPLLEKHDNQIEALQNHTSHPPGFS